MKRILQTICGVLFLAFLMTGCYKDIISPEADPDGPPQAVSFKEDIAPMLNSKCTNVGCHVPGGHKPYLNVVTQSYVNLTGGGFVNTLIPKESVIYKQINGSMAEYIPSKADRQKVYDWIRNGALNN